MQCVLLGAHISVVKQPYAYFSKELVQQIDASELVPGTVFSPPMMSKHQHSLVSMAHHSPSRLPEPGRAVAHIMASEPCFLVHTGAGASLCIFQTEAKAHYAGVAYRCLDPGTWD